MGVTGDSIPDADLRKCSNCGVNLSRHHRRQGAPAAEAGAVVSLRCQRASA